MYAELLSTRAASNLAKAQQANYMCDELEERQCLLFVVQDVATLLVMWQRGKISDEAAAKYAEILSGCSLRIKKLVENHG